MLNSGVNTGSNGAPGPLLSTIVSLTDEPRTVVDGHEPCDASQVSVGQTSAAIGLPRKPGGRCSLKSFSLAVIWLRSVRLRQPRVGAICAWSLSLATYAPLPVELGRLNCVGLITLLGAEDRFQSPFAAVVPFTPRMRTLVKAFGVIPCGVAVVTTIGEVLVTSTMSGPRLQKRKNRSTFGWPPACVVLGTTRNSGISWSPNTASAFTGRARQATATSATRRASALAAPRCRHRFFFPEELARRSVTTRLLRLREDVCALPRGRAMTVTRTRRRFVRDSTRRPVRVSFILTVLGRLARAEKDRDPIRTFRLACPCRS